LEYTEKNNGFKKEREGRSRPTRTLALSNGNQRAATTIEISDDETYEKLVCNRL